VAYYGRLKTKENFKLLIVRKLVTGALLRELVLYSDFTWKRLAFWKAGRFQEVVATGGLTVFDFRFCLSQKNESKTRVTMAGMWSVIRFEQ